MKPNRPPKPIVARTATLHAIVNAKPDTVIRAFKIVTENMGPYAHRSSDLIYKVGKEFEVPFASTNERDDCAVGLHVGTREWCLLCATHEASTVLSKHLFMEVEFKRSDVAAFPKHEERVAGRLVARRNGKFRVRRFRVISARVLTEAEMTRMDYGDSRSREKHCHVAPPKRRKRMSVLPVRHFPSGRKVR